MMERRDDDIVDPILLVADEINKYGIRNWSPEDKLRECATASYLGKQIPRGLEFMTEPEVFNRLLRSKAFSQRLNVPHYKIGDYQLDILAGQAHLIIRYSQEQAQERPLVG